jgi:hypothetical protein
MRSQNAPALSGRRYPLQQTKKNIERRERKMYNSGEAAEQIVRMSLQGSEVAIKLTGSASKHLAVLIYSILKDQKMTAGKARLINMLKTGKELDVFTLPAEDLKTFAGEAKRYGVLYCILREKGSESGMVDIMVKQEDSAKIDRIVQKLSLAGVEAAKVVAEIGKSRDSQGQEPQDRGMQEKEPETKEQEDTEKKPAKKEAPAPENPTTAKAEKSPRSETISKNRETSGRDSSDTSRKSVRSEMDDIRNERSHGKSGKGKSRTREKSPQAARNDELLHQVKSQASKEGRTR